MQYSIKKIIIDIALALLFPLFFYSAHYYFYFLIWVSFAPLIILAHRTNIYSFCLYLFPSIIFTSYISVSFVLNFNYEYFIFSFIFISTIFIVTYLFCFLLYRYNKIKYPLSILVLPVAWMLIVNLFNFVEGANVWFNFAHLQPMSYPVAWLIGSQGVTFLIMLANSLIAFLILKKDKKIILYLAVIFVILISSFAYSNFATFNGKKIKVALIQGNIDRSWDYRIEKSPTEILDIYKKLSLEAAKNNVNLIVWPEFAIVADITRDQEMYNIVSNIAKETNAYLIFGGLEKTEKTDPKYNYIKNVTYVFSNNGNFVGKYISVLPSPFNGEVIPGTETPIFKTPFGNFGITVCAEENYYFLNKRYADSGADFLINITNDNGLKHLGAMRLKSMHSQFSAAENNKYLLRSANTGFTEVVNPYGKIIAKLEPNTEGFLVADIFIK